MTLFKLSWKNMRRSLKDYAVYFFTLVLGVATFYIFNAMDSQTIMLEATSAKRDMIALTVEVMSALSFFVSIILGFLIIYANQFLIKRRKQEFAIYMLLGMSKVKISRILVFETLGAGLISLGAGLGIGIILSQGMSVVVAELFEVPLERFRFVFSLAATWKTLTYFGVAFLLVMVFNTVVINRSRLIDLLQARLKSEKLKLKNPVLCLLAFALGCILLGQAYYQVDHQPINYMLIEDIFRLMGQGALATFLVFWSLSGLFLRISRHLPRFYYHHLNSFILRELDAKMNTMVFSMSIICLMLFMTITVLASCLSLNQVVTRELKTYFPVDVQLTSNAPVLDSLENKHFDFGQFANYQASVRYYDEHLTRRSILGAYAQDQSMMGLDFLIQVMSESDYNALAEWFDYDPIHLSTDEYALSCNFQSLSELYQVALMHQQTLTVGHHTLVPAYQECLNSFVFASTQATNDGFLIVPDDCVSDLSVSEYLLTANYQVETDAQREMIDQQLQSLFEDDDGNTFVSINSKITAYANSIGVGTLLTFIGIYLGIIFLISSAAILALKQLSDCLDNKPHYLILRRIGADEKWLNRAICKQTAIFFGFPLLLACLHAYFGIRFMLGLFAYRKLAGFSSSIYMTALFLIFIYGGYFLVTYYASRTILKEDR